MADLIKNMSNAEYQKHPAISRSMLKELYESPKKYHYKYLSGDYEDGDSHALDIGTAYHLLILEPENFADVIAIAPDDKKKPTKAQINAKNPSDSTLLLIEWWDNFNAANEGKVILKEKDIDEIKAMAKAMRSTPEAQKILAQKGLIEPVVTWKDEDTGLDIKVKMDFVWLDRTIAVDLKSTADCSEDSFSRSIAKYGYDLQAYMQTEAVRRLEGKPPEAFIFATQEKKPPYETAFYVADADMIEAGRVKFKYLTRTLKECLDNNVWPSKVRGLKSIGLPVWEQKKVDELRGEIEDVE